MADQEQPTRIVYDDAEIRVVWHPGDSAFVLVTFGDVITLAAGHRFFADVPVKKARLNAVGLMAKRDNWYPKANVMAALEVIRPLLQPFRTRVLYGGSMGGYGAVKFSKALGATEVIALCPQWSIDKAECGGVHPGWQDHFRPEMAGMGIRPHEVAGAVFTFADALTNASDRFHCQMIGTIHHDVHFTNVPFVSHHVTPVMAGTDKLVRLIALCVARDRVALRSFTAAARRESADRKKLVIQAMVTRSPKCAGAIIYNQSLNNRDIIGENSFYLMLALRHLSAAAGRAAALEFYQNHRMSLLAPVEQLQVCAYLQRWTGAPVAVATLHGSVLVYDFALRAACHRRDVSPWQQLIQVEIAGTSATLFIGVGTVKFYLAATDRGELVIAGDIPRDSDRFAFHLHTVGRGHFAIAGAGRYVSAEISGHLICDRTAPNKWEHFHFTNQLIG